MQNSEQSLPNLLKNASPSNGESYDKYFEKIANLMMNNYVIKKGKTEYAIIEIEIYLFSEEHPDVITYPRNIDAGRWFFHQSGVDLTFKSDAKRFGGILIRSIRRLSDGNLILGPLKCMDELWDNFNAFTPQAEEMPILYLKEHGTTIEIQRYKRWIPITDPHKRNKKMAEWIERLNSEMKIKADEDLIFDSLYRYFAIPLNEIKNYPSKPKTKVYPPEF